jgi:TonB family protein
MDGSIINQDLARWSRAQWFWVVLAIFGAQMWMFWSARPVHLREVYPAEPKLSLPGDGASPDSSEWLKLEDPMLLAAPGWHGVSALAWMRKPETRLEVSREFPPLRFLSYADAQSAVDRRAVPMPARLAAHARPQPQPTLPVAPPPAPEPSSRLAAEGFGERALLGVPELPPQRHNDVVGRTVVQAAIDADGQVVSSRVVAPSGSRKADNDALALARGMRFEPLPGLAERTGEVTWGKLIFHWHALDLSRTNAVRRQ